MQFSVQEIVLNEDVDYRPTVWGGYIDENGWTICRTAFSLNTSILASMEGAYTPHEADAKICDECAQAERENGIDMQRLCSMIDGKDHYGPSIGYAE